MSGAKMSRWPLTHGSVACPPPQPPHPALDSGILFLTSLTLSLTCSRGKRMCCVCYHVPNSFALCFSLKKGLHTVLYNPLTKQTQPPAVKACPESLLVNAAGHLLPTAGAPDTRSASLRPSRQKLEQGRRLPGPAAAPEGSRPPPPWTLQGTWPTPLLEAATKSWSVLRLTLYAGFRGGLRAVHTSGFLLP